MSVKRVLLISIPILTIVFFILVMNSAFLFLKPGGYDLKSHISLIRQNVLEEDWLSVRYEMERLENKFCKKILPYVQFSTEKSELMDIELNIEQMLGCIDSENKSMALIYLRELEYNWKNLNR